MMNNTFIQFSVKNKKVLLGFLAALAVTSCDKESSSGGSKNSNPISPADSQIYFTRVADPIKETQPLDYSITQACLNYSREIGKLFERSIGGSDLAQYVSAENSVCNDYLRSFISNTGFNLWDFFSLNPFKVHKMEARKEALSKIIECKQVTFYGSGDTSTDQFPTTDISAILLMRVTTNPQFTQDPQDPFFNDGLSEPIFVPIGSISTTTSPAAAGVATRESQTDYYLEISASKSTDVKCSDIKPIQQGDAVAQ